MNIFQFLWGSFEWDSTMLQPNQLITILKYQKSYLTNSWGDFQFLTVFSFVLLLEVPFLASVLLVHQQNTKIPVVLPFFAEPLSPEDVDLQHCVRFFCCLLPLDFWFVDTTLGNFLFLCFSFIWGWHFRFPFSKFMRSKNNPKKLAYSEGIHRYFLEGWGNLGGSRFRNMLTTMMMMSAMPT